MAVKSPGSLMTSRSLEVTNVKNGSTIGTRWGVDKDVFILDVADNEAALLILLIKIEDSRRRLPSAQMCPFTMLLYLTDCCLKL